MKDLSLTPPERPNVEASGRDAMRAIWKEGGLTAVESEVIRIRVSFSSFDDFWDSNTVPVGPSGKALSELTPERAGAIKNAIARAVADRCRWIDCLRGLRQCGEGRRCINRSP